MSTLAASRTDILTVHDPFFAPLLPSMMPATAVPQATTTQPPPPARHDPSADTLPSIDVWRKSVIATSHLPPNKPSTTSANASAPPRDALARINPNTYTRRPVSASVPKPVRTPDVFSTERTTTGASASRSTGKRQLDHATAAAAAVGSSKKARQEFKIEEDAWRAKWVKIFPGLTFHFELGAESKALEQRVKMLGAKVDQFFSARITNLIVKSSSTTASKPMAPPPPRRSGQGALLRESPKNPFLDNTGVTDLAQKAEAMAIKVWTVDKLHTIVSRLAPPAETISKDSLHSLLEDERIHGTKERDLNAPRPDWYYFKPGSKYILIEDATNRHRTIMVKEFFFKDAPEWPTLYDRFLRPSSSVPTDIDPATARERAWALYVDQKPFGGEQPPHGHGHGRRSSACQQSTPRLPDALPYQNASGNSVVLTSNIASTSTANHSPAMLGQNPMAMYKDRALVQMNKRVQVLKGNARLAAAKRDSTPEPIEAAPPSRKTFLTREQLVNMLDQARQPVHDTVPAAARIRNREKVEAGLKGREQETAAGYCENCRLRYSDLSLHVASKKHRRFALDDSNFTHLDELLDTLVRPPNPTMGASHWPPCQVEHTKDDDCEDCQAYERYVESNYSDESGYSEGESDPDAEAEAEVGEVGEGRQTWREDSDGTEELDDMVQLDD